MLALQKAGQGWSRINSTLICFVMETYQGPFLDMGPPYDYGEIDPILRFSLLCIEKKIYFPWVKYATLLW